MDNEEEGPRNGHLGTTWEIAVITIFVVVVFAVIATVTLQVRRKRRQRRLQQQEADAELGRRGRRQPVRREQDAEKPDPGVQISLTVPEPVAGSARHPSRSKTSTPTSSYHDRDRPLKKPPAPRYYWDTSRP